jgi:hypothetical protein
MNMQGNSGYGQQPYGVPPPGNFGQPYGGGQRKKSGPSVLLILGIIAGVVAFGGLLVCGGMFYLVSQVAVDSKVTKQVIASDGLCELQVPSNWQDIGGSIRNEEASLQLGNLFAETYSMVLTEPHADFVGAETTNPNPDGSFSLRDYSDLIVSLMSSAEGSGLKKVSSDPVTMGGRSAIRFRLVGNVDGIPLVYILTVVDGENHFHQVHVWTLASRETSNMPTLLSVADSFQERK